MEDEDEQQNIPFWMQESNTEVSNDWSSMVFNFTSFLILVILMIGLWINFCIIPKMIRLMHRICNSKSLKRDLESLNIILILFAVICGLLAQLTSSPEEDYDNDRPKHRIRSPAHLQDDEHIVWKWNNARNPDKPIPPRTIQVHQAERSTSADDNEIYYDAESGEDHEEEITPQLFSTSPPPPPHETRRQWVTSEMPPPPPPYARLWAPSAPPLESSHSESTEGEYIIQRKRIGFMMRIVSSIRSWMRIGQSNQKRRRECSEWFEQISHPHPSSDRSRRR